MTQPPPIAPLGYAIEMRPSLVALLVACNAREQSPATAEATEAAAAIRTVYAFACDASDDPTWIETRCYGELKGYAHVLACATGILASARDKMEQIPSRGWRGACAREIDTRVRRMFKARVDEVNAWIDWLQKYSAELMKALASRTVAEACSTGKLFESKHTPACDNRPKEFDLIALAGVNEVECTKALFRCGLLADNVCWIQKAAGRLTVMPKDEEDYLYVRATGERVP